MILAYGRGPRRDCFNSAAIASDTSFFPESLLSLKYVLNDLRMRLEDDVVDAILVLPANN